MVRTRSPQRRRLARIDLFARCTATQLTVVDSLGTLIALPAGTPVWHESRTQPQFVIVLDGHITVTRAGEYVATLGPGAWYGHDSLLAGLSAEDVTGVVSSTPTRVLAFSRREFTHLLRTIPAVAAALQLDSTSSVRTARARQEVALERAGSHAPIVNVGVHPTHVAKDLRPEPGEVMTRNRHFKRIRRGVGAGTASVLLGSLALLGAGTLGLGSQAAAANTAVHVAAVSVSPTSYSGPKCPHLFTFHGTISATGRTTVKYRWIRSDNAIAPIITLTFAHAGSHNVAPETWTLGASGWTNRHFWEAIKILSPAPSVTSAKAHFTLTCT